MLMTCQHCYTTVIQITTAIIATGYVSLTKVTQLIWDADIREKCDSEHLHRPEWEHQWIHSCDWTTSREPWALRAIQSSGHCSRRSAQHTDMKYHSAYNTQWHLKIPPVNNNYIYETLPKNLLLLAFLILIGQYFCDHHKKLPWWDTFGGLQELDFLQVWCFSWKQTDNVKALMETHENTQQMQVMSKQNPMSVMYEGSHTYNKQCTKCKAVNLIGSLTYHCVSGSYRCWLEHCRQSCICLTAIHSVAWWTVGPLAFCTTHTVDCSSLKQRTEHNSKLHITNTGHYTVCPRT